MIFTSIILALSKPMQLQQVLQERPEFAVEAGQKPTLVLGPDLKLRITRPALRCCCESMNPETDREQAEV